MISTPLVSVIIATYNRDLFLTQAIESAQNQTINNIEIIVVDDGSTDSTPQILVPFSDYIRVVRQSNQGRSAARNAGVSHARGDIIAFLDSDDIWVPDKLEKQLSVFSERPEVGLVHTLTDVVDGNGSRIDQQTRRRWQLYQRALERGYTYEAMSEQCIMFLSTVAVRRDCWRHIGPMDVGIPAFEDWDWYLRAVMSTEIAIVPEVLVHFRHHTDNTPSHEFFEGRVRTCEKHLALLEERPRYARNDRVRRNFYLQLAGAHYVAGSVASAAQWMRKAVRLTPALLLHPSYFRYALAMLLPAGIFNGMRWISRQFFHENGNDST